MTVFSASRTSGNLVVMSLTVPEVPIQLTLFRCSFDVLIYSDAINSITYSPFLSAVVTIDHENIIKSYSVSPSTLGRGHALMDPGGPVWVSLLHSST